MSEKTSGGPAENEALFRSIVDNSLEVVKLVDPDGTLRYASPAFERILGYRPEEVVGKNVLDYVHPEDLPLVLFETEMALREPGVARNAAAYRFRHADGSWRHVESTGTYLLEDPAVRGVVVVTRDVTDRKRAEEAERRLRVVEEEHRALVETVPAITYVEDFETGDTLYDSPQIEEILGYPPDTFRYDPAYWKKIVHPDDRERIRREEARSAGSGRFSLEYRVFAADGRVVWLRDEARVVRGPQGEPAEWQGLLFDVTERRRIEEELRGTEERYRAIVEQIPTITYVFAQEPSGNSVPVYVSPHIEQILGYTQEEYVSDPGLWKRLLHPDDSERVLAEDERTGETGETFRQEFRMRAKDGSVVWFREEGRLVRTEGGAQTWHGVMVDITEPKETEARLREAERRYRDLVERVPPVVYVQRPTGTAPGHYDVTYMSPRAEQLFGFSGDAFVADPGLWDRLIHPEDLPVVRAEDERTDLTGEPFSMEYRMRRRDGGLVWVRDQAVLIRGEDEEPLYWQGVMSDVTERRSAEERLRQSEERYRALVEQVPVVNYTVETDVEGGTMVRGRILYIGPQVERVLGHPPEAFMDDPGFWVSLIHPDDREWVLAEDRRTDETGNPFSAEYRMACGDGRTVWVRDEAALSRDAEGRGLYWQGVLLDVTERKTLEQRLERRATHDPLTGLPNRVLLTERLDQALHRTRRKGSGLAVLFVDLDGFKEVNDSLGHDVGDRLLTGVADRLRGTVRPGDSVARFGGDEFVVLLEDADRAQALSVAQRIKAALETPFDTDAGPVSVAASVGLASSRPETAGPEELLREADRAMYRAKEEGKVRRPTPD